MTPQSSIQTDRGRFVPRVLIWLVALFWSCGGADSQVEVARHQFNRGDLERAEQGLHEVDGPDADDLRRQIALRRAHRREIEEAMESAVQLVPREEIERLQAFLEGVDDPVLVDRLESAISAAADRAAESSGHRRAQSSRQTREELSRAQQRDFHAGVAEGESRETRADVLDPSVSGTPAAHADDPGPEHAAGSTSQDLQRNEVIAAADAEPTTGDEIPVPEPEPVPEVAVVPEVSTIASAEALQAELSRAERVLIKASSARRDEAWSALEEHGAIADEFLTRALEARWKGAMRSLSSSASLKALERVAQDRKLLDLRRQEALELIFDAAEYFYPYRPPACPPDKARLYWPVQRRVDEFVNELRETWEQPRTAKLSKSFQQSLEEIIWCRGHPEYLRPILETPDEVPAWVFLVPAGVKTLNTQSFAWDAEDARRIANSRWVLAYNASHWSKKGQEVFEEDQLVGTEERRQVEITNEYRLMFGRQALAWNPKLQASTDGHSDYMARTGEFGHNEKGDSKRKTPFDRMRLVGYNYGVSENCYMGGGSPQGAHDGWCKSSGHHRNLLMPGHTEMASAVNGRHWTQNFGTDKEFRSEIDSWQD